MSRVPSNPGQRLARLLLLCGSITVGLGCEVHVSVGVSDEEANAVTDLVTERLKVQVNKSRQESADEESDAGMFERVVENVTQGDEEPDSPRERLAESHKDGEPFPIDLPTALRLAGAQNWNIELAAERVQEAQSAVDAAQALWMPSLVGGLGYNHHSGRIQATSGEVADVRRQSVFLGGGAQTGPAPLAGGAGGPLRFGVNLSLAEAIFRPLAARQRHEMEQARREVTFHDTLREAAAAYFDLVEAQAQLVVRQEDLEDAEALARQMSAFVDAGKGTRADRSRMETEVARRRQLLVAATAQLGVASARLARQLRLDPSTTLFSVDKQVVPIDLVDAGQGLHGLVDTALAERPEMSLGQAAIVAAEAARSSARWRPWLPHLQAGFSGGAFSGGSNGAMNRFGGRTDLDVLAVWEWQHLGVGNQAEQDAAASRERQAEIALAQSRDRIIAEVTEGWHRLEASQRRLKLSAERLTQATESLRLHRLRVRSLVGLPLEALQAVDAMALARQERLHAVMAFNRNQIDLLRAIGRPTGSE